MHKKLSKYKPLKKKKRRYIRVDKIKMQEPVEIVEQDLIIDESIPADNTTVIVENTIEKTKPCNSCAINTINKELKYNYIFSSACIAGLVFAIIILKKSEVNRLLIGFSIGIFGTLLMQSILKIKNLSEYKTALTKETP